MLAHRPACQKSTNKYTGIRAFPLNFAISEIVKRAENGAGGLIVVDVISRPLIKYYQECGLRPLYPQPDNWQPRNGTLRMFMEMDYARQIASVFNECAQRTLN